jgi:elongation factor Tu
MAQYPTQGAKPEISIGVLGQDGHGKTSLTRAIARMLTLQNDSVVEGDEIVIHPGDCREANREPYVYETGTRRYTHIDCSCHMDVVRNLIMDWFPLHEACLVVSAEEGVTEQMKEQVRLAQAVGVVALVVFLNKCDLVADLELLDVVELEVRNLLSKHGYAADTPVIRGSATAAIHELGADRFDLWCSKIRDLLGAMDTLPPPERLEGKPFLLGIEDVFTITGRGTVVTGRVERGMLQVNDPVEIVGLRPTRQTVATLLEMFGTPHKSVTAGYGVGILLRDVSRTEVQPGQVLAAPGTLSACSRFRAELYLLAEREGGRDKFDLSGASPQFFFRAVEIKGTLVLEEGAWPVRGGNAIRCIVELETAVALEPGLRFALREGGRSTGLGVVTEVFF